MFSPPRKKTKVSTSADRFIPIRRDSDGFVDQGPPVANTPYNESVYKTLTGMTMEQFRKRKLLYFSTQSIQNAKERTQNTADTQKISPARPRLDKAYKIMDAPNLLNDFYGCRIAWSANERIYVGLPDNSPATWSIMSSSLVNREETIEFKTQDTPLNTIHTYEDDYIFSGWDDGVIRIYQLSALSYAPTQEISTQVDPITCAVIMNNTTLFVGYHHGLIGQIDSRAPSSNCTYYSDRLSINSRIVGMAYNQEYYLLSGAHDGSVRVWDIRHMNQPVFKMHQHTAATKALAFNPANSRQFISGGGSDCRRLFSTHIATQTTYDLIDTGAQITGVHWFPSEPFCFVSSHSNGVKLWSLKPSVPIELLSTQMTASRAHSLVGSPTGDRFALGFANESISFFKPHGIKDAVPQKKQNTTMMLSNQMTIR